MKKISIFTPCYNEKGNISEMYAQVTAVMNTLPQYEYEYVFIDNKSTDGTREILREIASRDKHVKVIFNTRNFGPDQSGMHGFLATTGDVSICLACDLQDPPRLIPDFIKKWEEGYKVVWGQKVKSQENPLMYAIRTLYYKIINLFSNLKQYPHMTGFGAYDKVVMDEIRKAQEPDPLLRNLIPDLGYEVGIVEYEQPRRKSGRSHYNFFSYVDTAIKSLVNTSRAPLRLVTYIGIIFSILSFGTACYYFIYKIVHWEAFSLGMAPLLIGIFFLGSIQILCLGIIGEYLNDVLRRVTKKENVIEEERINFD
ncbi:glycosyltransferase family 2 protein [Lachnospiraceae bacterium 42-17]|nr:glycosyltransferase family 2 protein [Dorea sp.]